MPIYTLCRFPLLVEVAVFVIFMHFDNLSYNLGGVTCAELSTVMVMVMVTNRIDLESMLD